ncbi:3-hydroxyacyl-CoA dehydrogenase family protein [Tumebacillus permanentifrigoris]|uniref:3-hydroxyacyl-CoA dehydrogenase n=1 Tax=Tumebacillus permanentifrigoris TaxID=378543 RepID=A0A316DDI2_9BACL|nr:3-hydroxyacyl-CoA dehydrogenase NAD-binding domain-containing protein [Tumebacillus permanentifrigoris]PWK15592.1 3-hydroxyacyl-CoA dehydrogenase [Tumebacillus permanentifrigoris]
MNIQKIGIVGAGTMGQSMAETIAGKGFEVVLLDKSEQELEAAKLGLEMSLDRRLTKWGITDAEKKSILSRIVLGTNLQLLHDCEVVIESVWESLDDKIDVLIAIEKEVGPEALIASNTATLSITEIAAKTEHPERIIGLHFHFPVERRELVEVVRGLKTSERTVESAFHFIEMLGKQAVQVFESPGFITTRLMLPLINEAVLIFAEGVASAYDIDKAMKSGYGFHIGPLEMADRFGLDTVVDMLEALFHETTDPRYRPAAYLRKLVRGGRLGTKVREGFFTYDEWGERA